MEIHLYAHCWNEEKMLPYFFRHYDGIVDRYCIFDTGSTDGSVAILQAQPRVQLSIVRDEGPSYVAANLVRHNNAWKHSRGQADWVIVTDIDEHLYHDDLRGYLEKCRNVGVTLVVPAAFEMIADEFPTEDVPLHQVVRAGMRDNWMDKAQIFAPDRIEEINYLPGRHEAHPTGMFVSPPSQEVKLLHYKFLGLEYSVARYAQLKTGLRPGDIARQWGFHHLWDADTIRARFEQIKSNAVLVI